LKHLLQVRAREAAFDPQAAQRVIELGQAVFAVERGADVLCLHNVTAQAQAVTLAPLWQHAHDLLSGRALETMVTLQPYEVLWLQGDA
jgi:sucrose phosphorylase